MTSIRAADEAEARERPAVLQDRSASEEASIKAYMTDVISRRAPAAGSEEERAMLAQLRNTVYDDATGADLKPHAEDELIRVLEARKDRLSEEMDETQERTIKVLQSQEGLNGEREKDYMITTVMKKWAEGRREERVKAANDG